MAQGFKPAGQPFFFGNDVFILERERTGKGVPRPDIAEAFPFLSGNSAVPEDIRRPGGVIHGRIFGVHGAEGVKTGSQRTAG